VQVRPGRKAARSFQADALAAEHAVSYVNICLEKMPVQRHDSPPCAINHVVSVADTRVGHRDTTPSAAALTLVPNCAAMSIPVWKWG